MHTLYSGSRLSDQSCFISGTGCTTTGTLLELEHIFKDRTLIGVETNIAAPAGVVMQGMLRSLHTTLAVPAPTVETMPAALGMADDGASSEKKPKNRNGAEDPPAKMVAPALPLNRTDCAGTHALQMCRTEVTAVNLRN